ncbi:MAG: hypothetical protein HZB39_05545 [Planctomycetes bacterium]|nr:hypothetical protein [Planctomycetota bacterium]
MNSRPSLLPFAVAFLAAASSAQAPIAPGNLVVVRVGDGTFALTNAAQPVFLEQYDTTGQFVGTIPLPTSVNGAQRRVTNSGTATSEGFLTQSADGRYLISVGYDATPGTTSIATSASATVNRVVVRTSLDGTVDSSTALTDAYTGNNIRSAASDDGTRFWTSGPSNGPRFVLGLGQSTSTQLSTTVTNTRVVDVAFGQLYVSSATTALRGVASLGIGLPTVPGQTATVLPGFPSDASASNYDFFFADASTLYASDDRTTGLGGIQKWVFVAGTWVLQYTLTPATNVGCRGLTGSVVAGVATLYATTTQGAANQLVSVTDTGATSMFTTLATTGANQVFRGLRFVRCPSAGEEVFGVSTPHSGGRPDLGVSAPFVLGTSTSVVAVSMLGNDFALYLVGFRMPPFDLSLIGAQPNSELYVAVLTTALVPTDIAGVASLPIGVPPDPALCGAELTWQVVQVDPLLPYALPIATSRGLITRIGI